MADLLTISSRIIDSGHVDQMINRVNSLCVNVMLAGPKFIFAYGPKADAAARKAMVKYPQMRVLTIIGAPNMSVPVSQPGVYEYDAGVVTRVSD